MESNLNKQLTLLVDSRIDFGTFAHRTRREFERIALYLLRRWVPPSWYLPEDVVQELYLGAWIWVWDWSPKIGPSISQFVVFNAISHAKRQLHKARGAKLSGSADKNPSHIERPLSSLGTQEGDGDFLESLMHRGGSVWLEQSPEAEAILIREEEKKASVATLLDVCTTSFERDSIIAVAEAGDLDGGGLLIYEDIDQRISLRLVSENHATRVVTRAVYGVVERFEEETAS